MESMTRRDLLRFVALGAGSVALAACAPEIVKETVIVEKEKVVKEVVKETVVVQGTPQVKEKVVEKVVTATPAPKPPATLTHVEAWFGLPQFKEVLDPINEAINKKLQDEAVGIEFRSLILDDHATKYPLLYASGEEFTTAFDAPWYNMLSLREQGYLLPLEKLVEQYGPKAREVITEEIIRANFMFGHLYGLPIGETHGATQGACYRQDLLEKYGAPAPTDNWASLEPFLKVIKENEPNMVPYINYQYWTATWPNSQHNVNYTYDAIPGIVISDLWKETKLTDIEAEPWWMPAAELAYKWQNAGYMGREDMTAEEHYTRFQTGKTASISSAEPGWSASEAHQARLAQNIPGAKAAGFDSSGQLSGKVKKARQLRMWNFIVWNSGAKRDQQVAAMQYWNWLYSSQDNIDLWLFGIDGVNYKKEPNMRYTEVKVADPSRNYRRRWYSSGVPGKLQRMDVAISDEAVKDHKFCSSPESFRFNPIEGFLPDTNSLTTELATVTAALKEAAFPLMFGLVDPVQGTKAYTKALDAAGRQKVKAVIQAQLDAWIAANLK